MNCRSVCFILVLLTMGNARAKATAECTKTVVSQNRLPSSFEPSDAIWDIAMQRLWVVSDEGEVASLTYDSNTITYWTLPHTPDLEGIVQIPGREDYVYLQIEDAQQLLEFNKHTGIIETKYQLEGPGGLEAVAWITTNDSTKSVLYAGGQLNGVVYVHTIDFKEQSIQFVQNFSLPEPNPGDLSALHYEIDLEAGKELLTALYDMHQLMVLYSRDLGEESNLKWEAVKYWTMPDIGSEGIAWAEVDGHHYFYVCIDTSKGAATKVRAIHRYNADQLDSCFNATKL